jgi:hypothetical protein
MAAAPRPEGIGFGIRVDGRDAGITFPTISDAEGGATQLLAHGYTQITIFDRVSGRVIDHVSPNPKTA